ncbi:pilin [bacterium]|nr:pilin [bacterium]
MNYKNFFIFLFSLFLFLFVSNEVFGADWPTIGKSSISSESGTAEVAVYFLTLATAAGSVIMAIMIMKGGFDFMNAGGNLGKISRAKNQIIGSAIGMLILLGVFIILNTINSELVSPKNVKTECVIGIKRKITQVYEKENGKQEKRVSELCYNTDQPDLEKDFSENTSYEDLGSSYPPCVLREVITFSEKDYQGKRTVIFKDDGSNDDDCPPANKIKFGSAKSVKIFMKKDGVYLYGNSLSGSDSADEEIGPIHFSKGVEDLSSTNFNDKAQRIEIVNKGLLANGNPFGDGNISYGNFYGAILFSEANYRGKCFAKTSRNIDQSKEDDDGWASLVFQKDFATGEKVDLRGSLSSMIVFKSPLTLNEDKAVGSVDIYAVPNCGDISKDPSVDDGKYDICHINISPGSNGFQNLEKIFFEKVNNSACLDDFKDKKDGRYPIQSFRINGAAGVVLKSDAGNCHYFDVKTNDRRGNCFTNLQDTFKTSLGQEKIKTIMIIPLEN